ncbi:MAG: hypothetical protein ABIH99_06055, partial [Candidatus Micrarchaeota archaeon]
MKTEEYALIALVGVIVVLACVYGYNQWKTSVGEGSNITSNASLNEGSLLEAKIGDSVIIDYVLYYENGTAIDT